MKEYIILKDTILRISNLSLIEKLDWGNTFNVRVKRIDDNTEMLFEYEDIKQRDDEFREASIRVLYYEK